MRVVHRGEPRFTLPSVDDVSTLPQSSLRTTMMHLVALAAAVCARMDVPTVDELEDALTPAEASAVLKLDGERSLREPKFKAARYPTKVGGEPRFSRRKLCAILRGDPV